MRLQAHMGETGETGAVQGAGRVTGREDSPDCFSVRVRAVCLRQRACWLSLCVYMPVRSYVCLSFWSTSIDPSPHFPKPQPSSFPGVTPGPAPSFPGPQIPTQSFPKASPTFPYGVPFP